jgi:hypothetical protein
VENYVGCGAYIRLAAEYDVNAMILLLMTVFEGLNPIVQACAMKVVGLLLNLVTILKIYIYLVWVTLLKIYIFVVGASMEESSCTFVVGELYPCSRGYR